MIKVYVDTGGWMPALNQLKASGMVEAVHFPYEQRLKRMDETAPASDLTWESAATWEDLDGQSWVDTGASSVHPEIEKIIGAHNKVDVQHMDSAHKAECQAFITSDKGDIWKHREALMSLLGIRVFHSSSEWDAFVSFCNEFNDNAVNE